MLFFIFLPCLFIFYRFFIARILSVLPENFRDWGGCRPPPPPARTPMPLGWVGGRGQGAGGRGQGAGGRGQGAGLGGRGGCWVLPYMSYIGMFGPKSPR